MLGETRSLIYLRVDAILSALVSLVINTVERLIKHIYYSRLYTLACLLRQKKKQTVNIPLQCACEIIAMHKIQDNVFHMYYDFIQKSHDEISALHARKTSETRYYNNIVYRPMKFIGDVYK